MGNKIINNEYINIDTNTNTNTNTNNHSIKLIPLYYHSDYTNGDATWELLQENNNNTLFIYNDNETRLHGSDGVSKFLRKYDKNNIKGIEDIRSAGIPMNLYDGEFKSLRDLIKYEFNIIPVQKIIDFAISDIQKLLMSFKYDRVKYFCHSYYDNNEWYDIPVLLAKQKNKIPPDVNDYIINKLDYIVNYINIKYY